LPASSDSSRTAHSDVADRGIVQRSGLATSAIRYYEELGLLQPTGGLLQPTGRQSGRRVYNDTAAARLRAITAAREAGFSLEEIRALLDSQAEVTNDWRRLVNDKITEVESRIARRQAIGATLRASLDCGCQAWDECPILPCCG
jgi:DNA-binding transcriptional MerR regulator